MRPYALLALFGCALAACSETTPPVAWRFRFADATLASRALVVRTEIRFGGCSGAPAFVTRVADGVIGETPPELAPGRYGFYGRARDADCFWFAEGCAEADLPSKATIEVVLDRALSDVLDSQCVPGELSEDPATGDSGGTGGGSSGGSTAGNGNAGGTSGGTNTGGGTGTGTNAGEPDGGGMLDVDASLPGFDATAPKCTGLDPQVVACYDFDGSLADATPSHNDVGPATNATFEAALSGHGVRPDGKTLAVPDAPSLNVSAFTVELWLRPDGLINLDGQTNDITLLIDKDQQYNVGYTSHGELRMEVYRGLNDTGSTTAETAVLKVGEFAYAAFVYDGSTSVMYLNGQRAESELQGFALFAGNGGPMHIGSGSPGTTRPFDGLIDALRISNVARSDADICSAAGKQLDGGNCL